MDETYTTKDTRGVDLEKEWNEGFDHARWVMAYD